MPLMGPDCPLARREAIDFPALASTPFIALRPTTLLRSQIDIAATRAGAPINPVIETNSGATACEFVARGLGVTIADPIVAKSFERRGVVVRRLAADIKLTYGFLLPGDELSDEKSSALRTAFINAARELGQKYVKTSSQSAI